MKYTSIERGKESFLVRYIHNGQKQRAEIPFVAPGVFKPELFFESKTGLWNGLYGQKLARKEYNNIFEFFSDAKKENAFGTRNLVRQFVNKVKFDDEPPAISDLKIIVLDIEVFAKDEFPEPKDAKYPVVLVQAYDINEKKVIIWGLKPFNGTVEHIEDGIDFEYVPCADEKELILKFLDYLASDFPDIITGWNIDSFDLPYLLKRTENVFGKDVAKRFSPWEEYRVYEKFDRQFHKKRMYAKILGISNLDYMQLYKKFSFKNVKSYSLDYVGNLELKIGKIDYDGRLADLYENDYDRFVRYGVRDVEIVKLLDDKFSFLSLVLSISYISGCNHNDAFSPIALWEGLIYRNLYRNKTVPPIEKNEHGIAAGIPGAYVHDPVPGKYEWIASFDFNSLYPHIIMQFNISPETIAESRIFDFDQVVEGEKIINEAGTCVSGSGWAFRNDKEGIFGKIMRELYKTRKDMKNEMLETKKEYQKRKSALSDEERKEYETKISSLHSMQLALKVLLNSGYGAMSNPYFQYFDERLSSSVTLTGQAAIKYISRKIDDFFQHEFGYKPCIYMDTDSVYLHLKPMFSKKDFDDSKIYAIIKDFCDTVLQKKIDEFMESFAASCGCRENLLRMKREKIARAGIWTAKKRYALAVINDEGVEYDDPKIAITGLEIVRSTTPDWVVGKLYDVVKMLLTSDDFDKIVDYIKEIKEEFMHVDVDEISQTMGISEYDKFIVDGKYRKGTPKHVKAAYNHNKIIKMLGFQLKPIGDGDKIKFIDLSSNRYNIDVIGWDSSIDFPFAGVFGNSIDRNKLWHKTFEKPVAAIFEAIGMNDFADKLMNGNIDQKSLF